jgi:hypothetical protein
MLVLGLLTTNHLILPFEVLLVYDLGLWGKRDVRDICSIPP